MNLKSVVAGLLLSAGVASGFAATETTFDNIAKFVLEPESASTYSLKGFGRVTTVPEPEKFGSFARASLAPGREYFSDTWNIDLSEIAPGEYSFSSVIAATGTVEFLFVELYYFKSPVATKVAFTVNDDGTQATGSGLFTVEKPCRGGLVASCVWLKLYGIQDKGGFNGGYEGDIPAAAVPEPQTYALLLAGLAAVCFAASRRKVHAD